MNTDTKPTLAVAAEKAAREIVLEFHGALVAIGSKPAKPEDIENAVRQCAGIITRHMAPDPAGSAPPAHSAIANPQSAIP